MAPTVSVVLPTYNRLVLLPRAIRSVLEQTFADFELVVVDDGSTDGTADYLSTLTDPRIRVIRQPNQRLPGALNTGFAASHGEFLTWVSDDNWMAPIFLEALLAALRAHPEAGFAHAAFMGIDIAGRMLRIDRGGVLTYPRLLASNFLVAPFLYPRRCYEGVGGYDTSAEGAEDWDMWLRITRRERAVRVPDVLCYYRLHKGQMTQMLGDDHLMSSAIKVSRKHWTEALSMPITTLYPAIEACSDRAKATFFAYLWLGTGSMPFHVDASIAMLERAVALNPGSIPAVYNLTLCYARSERWNDARKTVAPLRSSTEARAKRLARVIDAGKASLVDFRDRIDCPTEGVELFQVERQQVPTFAFIPGPSCS